MPNEEVSLSDEKRRLYEALGIEGVVSDILGQAGTGQIEKVKQAGAWLRKERKRQECRADLRFWIPQAIALLAAILATIAVFNGGGE